VTPIATTLRSWHGVAELVLAGPQYRLSGTIRLRPTPGGFGTVTEPPLRVDGVDLISGLRSGGRRLPLAGRTYAEVAADAGVDVGAPVGVYGDGPGIAPDETMEVDPAVAAFLADGLALGEAALREFAPEATPVLWPEHFDLAISVDEVNYGVSLGDGHLPEPYAYVGPWRPRTGPFFDAPFGAARPLRELPDPAAVAAYFAAGRAAAAESA
jgi:hypothetical protein